jgi:hypothetical protein
MRFYRLHRYEIHDGSHGFEFFTNLQDANKARRDWFGNFEIEERVCDCEGSEIDEIEIKPTKQGILKALRTYASHNDNG